MTDNAKLLTSRFPNAANLADLSKTTVGYQSKELAREAAEMFRELTRLSEAMRRAEEGMPEKPDLLVLPASDEQMWQNRHDWVYHADALRSQLVATRAKTAIYKAMCDAVKEKK